MRIESRPEKHRAIAIRANANGADTFSSVWKKVLDEISWAENAPTIGFVPVIGAKRMTIRQVSGIDVDEISIDDVRRVLSILPGSVFVIDEFDRLHKKQAAQFTDLIKARSQTRRSTQRWCWLEFPKPLMGL